MIYATAHPLSLRGIWIGFDSLYDEERNQKNSHFLKTLNCSYNFREYNTEALVISKRLKLP